MLADEVQRELIGMACLNLGDVEGLAVMAGNNQVVGESIKCRRTLERVIKPLR
jgi:hypothetical protein